jgi:hypothetical protein
LKETGKETKKMVIIKIKIGIGISYDENQMYFGNFQRNQKSGTGCILDNEKNMKFGEFKMNYLNGCVKIYNFNDDDLFITHFKYSILKCVLSIELSPLKAGLKHCFSNFKFVDIHFN